MRLTYKLEEPIITKYLHYDYMLIADYDIKRGNYGKISQDEIYNKLGQLEDIEDELGIDLITLFKALKNGIYTKQYGYLDVICVGLGGLIVEAEFIENYKDIFYYYDYGKTWALTKKELE